MKIQAIQAWGWFIRMLGSHALKNKHLVNDMLKIPQRTFTDPDPQIQIATQVAWEGLIDALVYHRILVSEKKTPSKDQVNGVSEKKTPAKSNFEDQVNGVYKSIKLLMTPLIGIMSSKCDISASGATVTCDHRSSIKAVYIYSERSQTGHGMALQQKELKTTCIGENSAVTWLASVLYHTDWVAFIASTVFTRLNHSNRLLRSIYPLGMEVDLNLLKKMSAEYAEAKNVAIKEASSYWMSKT
ncbi:hypothetical protein QL285_095150 [Trifolium repens]|nr:hypothetical protein QL285_095150 [Trifolium repens]